MASSLPCPVSDDLRDWGRRMGAAVCDGLDWFSEFSDSGRGVRALRDMELGEVLVSIPKAWAIAVPSHSDVPGSKSKVAEALLASDLDPQQKLALLLLHEISRCNASPFSLYCAGLPKSLSDLPFFFGDEQLELLWGTGVDSVVRGGHLASPAGVSAMAEVARRHPEMWPTCTDEAIQYAAAAVASRAFDSDATEVCLLPIADMFNHFGASPHTRMRETESAYVLRLERPVTAGEQVFMTYGNLPNFQLFINGAFVESDNPFDAVEVSCQEAIAAGPSDEIADDRIEDLLASGVLDPGRTWLVSRTDLLPDGLATVLAVLGSPQQAYQEWVDGGKGVVDLAADVAPGTREAVYLGVLRLVTLLRARLRGRKRNRAEFEAEDVGGAAGALAATVRRLRDGMLAVIATLEEQVLDAMSDDSSEDAEADRSNGSA